MKAIAIIKAAVTTVQSIWDLAEPKMRAAQALHKALPSMLQPDQQDMAGLVLLEYISSGSSLTVHSASKLAWIEGLSPLPDRLSALNSPNDRLCAPAWLVKWDIGHIRLQSRLSGIFRERKAYRRPARRSLSF